MSGKSPSSSGGSGGGFLSRVGSRRSQYSSLRIAMDDDGDENEYNNHNTVQFPLQWNRNGHTGNEPANNVASVVELRRMLGSQEDLQALGERKKTFDRSGNGVRSDSLSSYGDYAMHNDEDLFCNGEDGEDGAPSGDGPPERDDGFENAHIVTRGKSKGVNRFLSIDSKLLNKSKSHLSLSKSFKLGGASDDLKDENEELKNRFGLSGHGHTPSSREQRLARKGGGGGFDGAVHDYDEMVEAIERVKRMAKFESHDYDQPASEFEDAMRRDRPLYDYVRMEMWKWGLSALIGITMGIISFFVDWGISALISAKYNATKSFISPDTKGFASPFFVYMAFTWGFALVAASLVSYVEPLAAGSGIPELKTYLNGVHLKGLLQLKTLAAKLIGIMFSISCGLIAGKEGPFVHGGGVVGGGIAALGSQSLRFKLPRWLGGYFRNDSDHRDFVAIGTAAGVATAFAAPIGGVLFTVEEGASWYTTSILWRGFLATSLGVLTLHYLVELREHPSEWPSAHFGTHRDFGLYSDSDAHLGSVFWYYGWEIPIFLILGALGGALGSLFIHVNVRITKLRQQYIPVKAAHRRVMEVVFVATITAIVFFIATYFSPCAAIPNTVEEDLGGSEGTEFDGFLSGADDEDHKENFYQQLWCDDGQYNIFGQLFFVPLAEALRLIYHLGETVPGGYEFPIEVLMTFFAVVYTLMTWTYGVGAATGLFVPSLAVGAALGRGYGRMIAAIFSKTTINLQTYAIIGSAASLGGATRMTISITVLIMETTGALQLLIPIMLTVFVAKVVGDYFNLGTINLARAAPPGQMNRHESYDRRITRHTCISRFVRASTSSQREANGPPGTPVVVWRHWQASTILISKFAVRRCSLRRTSRWSRPF